MDLKEADEIYNSQRLPQVPDTLVAGGDMPSVTFTEPVSSTPCLRLHPPTVDLSVISSTKTLDKETEDELVRNYHPPVKKFEGGARPKTVHPVVRAKQGKSTAAHSLQIVAEEFKKNKGDKNIKIKRRILSKCYVGLQLLVKGYQDVYPGTEAVKSGGSPTY